MTRLIAGALVAGLVAVVACSHTQTPSERTQAAAASSQQAFQQAADDQKKLEEQQKRVEAARQETAKAQKALQDAQHREEQERSKARELQQQANRHLEDATDRARQAREAASQGSGVQTVAGRIAEATPGHVVLQTPGGEEMPFRVDDRTRVVVGSQQRSAAEIQRGADARVAYSSTGDGGQPTALSIQVTPLGAQSPAGNAGAGSGSAMPMPSTSSTATPMPSTPPPSR